VETFELTNPVKGETIGRGVQVLIADHVHQGAIIAMKQRNHPAPTERDCYTKLVAEVPEVLPPSIRGQVPQTIIVF
jgi:hypothetical protein